MKIARVYIENFRAIRQVELSGLTSMVVIAGANGAGKSCIFDAIRLLKSSYGGYHPSEWQQWFGEFQIDINRRSDELNSFFRDRKKSVKIEAEFSFTDREKKFLTDNLDEIAESVAWGQRNQTRYYARLGAIAREIQSHQKDVDEAATAIREALILEIPKSTHVGSVTISPDVRPAVRPNAVLEAVATIFTPQDIGVIDYHSATRTYTRENVGGINLNIETADEQRKQHALYNSANKYSNIKSEMASGYIRELIAKELGQQQAGDGPSLIETMKDLFTTFFPGKKFIGPQPTEALGLAFPVEVGPGNRHDINDLSSGEKEVLFGYLRLRNSAPRDSVILLDEPELHLNPGLIRGLPLFYQKHIGRALGNQMWLVTHSDTFLRHAVGQPDFSVFHLSEAGIAEGNQARRVEAGEDFEKALIDLVGDLAVYRPGARIVLLEGENSEFDLRVIGDLFPEIYKRANFVSAGSKNRVKKLHHLLDKALTAGGLAAGVSSIADLDSDRGTESTPLHRHHTWDRYHIENYLLEAKFIVRVLASLRLNVGNVASDDGVLEQLRLIAAENSDFLVRHTMQNHVNDALVGLIRLETDRARSDIATAVAERAAECVAAARDALTTSLSSARLADIESAERATLELALRDGTWINKFPGREILRQFAGKYAKSLRYETFRDLVLSKMVDESFQPPSMHVILEAALAPPSR